MDRMIDEFIYFVRTSEDMIPLPNSLDEAVAALPNHVEIGYVNGRSLLALERLITQVRLMFAVGITFAPFLNISSNWYQQITYIFRISRPGYVNMVYRNPSLFALTVHPTGSQDPWSLHSVTRATTIAQLMYAIPSWWGITAENDRAKIERLYNWCKRMGYLPADAPVKRPL